MSNLVEISIDDITDEILEQYFLDENVVFKIASMIFSNFFRDWITTQSFNNRKIDDLKYEFFYDIEVDLDDVRKYYTDMKAIFYHDKEYDDYKVDCSY